MSNHDRKLSVLVVDDTLTYRTILIRVLEGFEQVAISGTAKNGQAALDAMIAKPADLILMDLEMPEMNGLEATKAIHQRFPEARIVMISGTNRDSANLTLEALEAGAMDFIAKPGGDSLNSNMEELRQRLKAIILTCIESRKSKQSALTERNTNSTSNALRILNTSGKLSERAIQPKLVGGFDILAIGVSTGGPNALAEIIPILPASFPLPIVIVQHMPPVFTASLANMLDKKSELLIKEAEANETLLPGTVYIAPGGRHMKVQSKQDGQYVIAVNDEPAVNSCRPSVDVLFQSLPGIYKNRVLSVILTGMGQDGLAGVRAVKAQGGYCLTQSENTCVVYGMPRAVDEHGLSDEQIPLSEIAARLKGLVLSKSRG